MKTVSSPVVGPIRFVPRDLLRRKVRHGRQFCSPLYLRALAAQVPNPPLTFNWRVLGSGVKLPLPMYGNNIYGDCYYTAACHLTQLWTGNNGLEASFDVNAVVQRYITLSRGDNGLGDDQIIPEFEQGIVGPNGKYKIVDDMTINPADDASIKLAIWTFGGCFYTAALLNTWQQNMNPGAVWDANGIADQRAGHAMVLSGVKPSGNYDTQTWGFDPSIELTPAGLKTSDPEIVVCFSMLWFNSQGYAPNGLHYNDAAAIWLRCGGKPVPPWMGPAPTPIPPIPVPPIPTPQPPAPIPSPVPLTSLGARVIVNGVTYKATGWERV